jgi:hypothetical protein
VKIVFLAIVVELGKLLTDHLGRRCRTDPRSLASFDRRRGGVRREPQGRALSPRLVARQVEQLPRSQRTPRSTATACRKQPSSVG